MREVQERIMNVIEMKGIYLETEEKYFVYYKTKDILFTNNDIDDIIKQYKKIDSIVLPNYIKFNNPKINDILHYSDFDFLREEYYIKNK